MNLAIVLDLGPSLGRDEEATVRALVDALNDARDIGDRFTLLVAGQPGGLIVPADDFRHGPLAVALQQMFGAREETSAPPWSLSEALHTAYATVAQGDDPTSMLGSSGVVLVTARELGGEVDAVESRAHAQAVAGIPTSVIALGSGTHPEEIDRIALAGQGSRRALVGAADARRVVQSELSAVSRVIARAVRLRIRLMPGVQLVDVLGSHRLDEARAQEVRDAERSIDRRLSRNLGIEADRGEDEEGLQIVIPAFSSGDAHVIMLDVVVPGPGAVAEVTVRFKDLIQLGNGVTRENLTLESGALARGPLQRNVVKSLLAFELSRVLLDASAALDAGDPATASAGLRGHAAVLAGLRAALGGLMSDRDLSADAALLAEYVGLLDRGAALAEGPRAHLADSMRFASYVKLLPRPERD